MKMTVHTNGKISISGDEHLIKKIEGVSLVDVDVSDLRVDSDSLAELYCEAATVSGQSELDAEGLPVWVENLDKIKRYAVMKQKYLETFSA
ncbi:hypothetical protein ACFRCQ_18145 [Cytobacillus firmus]|uniref:hypothetical protein n=1 Tax=Cytobacillus firmus TaxID=1399 RepID=UPI00367AA493